MSMKGYFLGFRVLAPMGARGTEEHESRRQKTLKEEFMRAVPAAGRLKASDLGLLRHHTETGCRLEYYLRQRPQYELDWDEQTNFIPADVKSDADFRSDVEAVSLQLESTAARLALATSPSLTYRELTEDSQDMEDIRTLRRLYGRRGRALVMPTANGEQVIRLQARPEHLPTALGATVTAHVLDLIPGGATLADIVPIADSHGKPWAESGLALLFPQRLKAERHANLPSASKLAMVDGVDNGGLSRLTVTIKFDWVTGRPTGLVVIEAAPDAQ